MILQKFLYVFNQSVNIMKKLVCLLIGMLLTPGIGLTGRHKGYGMTPLSSDSVTVLVSPDLYGLSGRWAAEYNKLNPGLEVRISTAASPESAAKMIEDGRLGLLSSAYMTGLKNAPSWNEVIGRDVIVPVINARSPYMNDIQAKGISPGALAQFFGNNELRNWNTLTGKGMSREADVFFAGGELTRKMVAAFLNCEESVLNGISTGSSENFISAIRSDPYAIGFCRLSDIQEAGSGQLTGGLSLMPLDRNSNGLIDFNEQIYDNINDFTRGVWIGKYPRALVGNIFAASSSQPVNKAEISFIKWLLAGGQKFLPQAGYTGLTAGELQSAVDRMNPVRITSASEAGGSYLLKSLLFTMVILLIAGFGVAAIARKRKTGITAGKPDHPAPHRFLDEGSVVIPRGLYFDKTHTWAFMEPDGLVRVGIDDFLQHVTGRITRLKARSAGKRVKKGDQIFSLVQNGKQLNLYAPVSGTIVEHNELLESDCSALNSSPYMDGWICKIEPSGWTRESQLLLMGDKHREFIKKEFTRLKDFLMNVLRTDPDYSRLILQDGGEVSDGVLSAMGPEVWEDFQTNFIDPSRQIWFYELFNE
jgi:glycine cleavage system H lipoate-binding protein/ABC-type phosphate transport system substrate-binding protein